MMKALMLHVPLKPVNPRAPATCYDFVYVPHNKDKNSNVALAFVNFVDHLSARTLGPKSRCRDGCSEFCSIQGRHFTPCAFGVILRLAAV